MFSSIRHIPHVHRLSSFCVTGYQHGRQETKTVTELKNISCRRSLSFCPPLVLIIGIRAIFKLMNSEIMVIVAFIAKLLSGTDVLKFY